MPFSLPPRGSWARVPTAQVATILQTQLKDWSVCRHGRMVAGPPAVSTPGGQVGEALPDDSTRAGLGARPRGMLQRVNPS